MQEVTGSTPVFSTRSARCGQKPYLVQARLFLWTVPILSGAADSGTSGSFAVGYSGFGKRRGNFCRRPYRLKESRETGSIDLPVDTRLASLCRNQRCVRCRQCFTGAAAWTGRKNKTPRGERLFPLMNQSYIFDSGFRISGGIGRLLTRNSSLGIAPD